MPQAPTFSDRPTFRNKVSQKWMPNPFLPLLSIGSPEFSFTDSTGLSRVLLGCSSYFDRSPLKWCQCWLMDCKCVGMMLVPWIHFPLWSHTGCTTASQNIISVNLVFHSMTAAQHSRFPLCVYVVDIFFLACWGVRAGMLGKGWHIWLFLWLMSLRHLISIC
jgi:hypothetical protein